MYPVRLDAGGAAGAAAIKAVKEQLRALPDNGIGYGLLRYLTDRPLPEARAPLGFNYLGRVSTSTAAEPWGIAPEADRVTGAGAPRSHPIAVSAMTHDDADGPRLVATWTWAGEHCSRADAEELARAWFRALHDLTASLDEPGAGGYTPSDLGLVELSQDEIELLEAEWRTLQ
jgi:non-ribosomal peptide synthase protein (TIGR01720 family)